MCEWNYKVDRNGQLLPYNELDDATRVDSLVMRARRFVWRLTPWRHGPECPVRRLLRIGEIVGAND